MPLKTILEAAPHSDAPEGRVSTGSGLTGATSPAGFGLRGSAGWSTLQVSFNFDVVARHRASRFTRVAFPESLEVVRCPSCPDSLRNRTSR